MADSQIAFETEPSAWLVIAADGFRALFLNQGRANQYAVNCHGVVHPLYQKED